MCCWIEGLWIRMWQNASCACENPVSMGPQREGSGIACMIWSDKCGVERGCGSAPTSDFRKRTSAFRQIPPLRREIGCRVVESSRALSHWIFSVVGTWIISAVRYMYFFLNFSLSACRARSRINRRHCARRPASSTSLHLWLLRRKKKKKIIRPSEETSTRPHRHARVAHAS